MAKKHAMKSVVFWVVWLMALALVGEGVPARADVYRASVAPRPATSAAPSSKSGNSVQASTSSKASKATTSPQKTRVQPSAPAKKKGAVSAAKSKSAVKKEGRPTKSVKKSASKTVRKKTTAPARVKASSTTTRSAQKKVAVKSKKSSKLRPAAKGKGTSSRKARKSAAIPVRSGASKDLHLNVKSALLINMSTGKVYFEQNADKSIAPASITKLLTLYLVREAMARGSLKGSTPIPVSSLAVRTGGSSMSLRRGERVPLTELIKGISVVSANNACVAIAEYLGQGDMNHFVRQMNAKAKALGMTQSRFRNPNGLPAPGQLSTARDIAKLSMAYLRTFPESLSVHSMTTHTYHGATHRNANSLLRTYRGVDGLKTGFVCASGYNITATAKRGKTRLLAVVLGAQSAAIRQVETARLLDYGFKRVVADGGDATLARK
ncbi:MAG: D-alanyl-D-alanine carboxypeptidase [Deltaproteobacteria bacterium]|nr:D-alanyl-D-alanine carboxypeptidase [Deltaproteobacteria bacterium]